MYAAVIILKVDIFGEVYYTKIKTKERNYDSKIYLWKTDSDRRGH